MESTKITLVRHGETEWNLAVKLQGHLDSPLTPTGIHQAKLLAERFRSNQFDAFFSSDLGRAVHTSEILNFHLKLSIIANKNLRERKYGVLEGLSRKEISVKYPEAYQALKKKNTDYFVPESESQVDFTNRVVNEIDKIAKEYLGGNVLIVTHGGVLDCIIRRIFNIENNQRVYSIRNTSINSISIKRNDWILEEWGNIDHLL